MRQILRNLEKSIDGDDTVR